MNEPLLPPPRKNRTTADSRENRRSPPPPRTVLINSKKTHSSSLGLNPTDRCSFDMSYLPDGRRGTNFGGYGGTRNESNGYASRGPLGSHRTAGLNRPLRSPAHSLSALPPNPDGGIRRSGKQARTSADKDHSFEWETPEQVPADLRLIVNSNCLVYLYKRLNESSRQTKSSQSDGGISERLTLRNSYSEIKAWIIRHVSKVSRTRRSYRSDEVPSSQPIVTIRRLVNERKLAAGLEQQPRNVLSACLSSIIQGLENERARVTRPVAARALPLLAANTAEPAVSSTARQNTVARSLPVGNNQSRVFTPPIVNSQVYAGPHNTKGMSSPHAGPSDFIQYIQSPKPFNQSPIVNSQPLHQSQHGLSVTPFPGISANTAPLPGLGFATSNANSQCSTAPYNLSSMRPRESRSFIRTLHTQPQSTLALTPQAFANAAPLPELGYTISTQDAMNAHIPGSTSVLHAGPPFRNPYNHSHFTADTVYPSEFADYTGNPFTSTQGNGSMNMLFAGGYSVGTANSDYTLGPQTYNIERSARTADPRSDQSALICNQPFPTQGNWNLNQPNFDPSNGTDPFS